MSEQRCEFHGARVYDPDVAGNDPRWRCMGCEREKRERKRDLDLAVLEARIYASTLTLEYCDLAFSIEEIEQWIKKGLAELHKQKAVLEGVKNEYNANSSS